MAGKKCYLGIDIGTSGTKALIMAANGKVLSTATSSHTIQSPAPGYSEQSPQQWWRASAKASAMAVEKAGINPAEVAAVSFSGQMHGLVCLDAKGKLLRPAIIWNDQRSAPQCQQITEKAGGDKKLIKLCGNVAMASFTLTKLLWVKQNEPEVYDKIAHILLPKDYVRYCMTGEIAGDASDMSGTMMLDPKTRDWSGKMLSMFDIDSDILPKVYESTEIVGKLTARAAKQMNLTPGIAVTAGGGDQAVVAIGNGVVKAGLVSATIGTSGTVYIHNKQYINDPAGRLQSFCASVPGEYCMFGCMLSAGGSFQWLRNTIGQPEMEKAAQDPKLSAFDLMVRAAQKAPAGCEGLFWMPYLTGERTPHNDPLARAGWVGATLRTGRNELIRSVIEGITFGLGDVIDAIRASDLKVSRVRLAGGGTRSRFWRQLQADIYNAPCELTNSHEGSALGAAILAAVGNGEYSSVAAACRAIIKVKTTINPDRVMVKKYRKLHDLYSALYPALAANFAETARVCNSI